MSQTRDAKIGSQWLIVSIISISEPREVFFQNIPKSTTLIYNWLLFYSHGKPD